MALTSLAIATALVFAAAALQLAAATAPIGLPGCNTSCGDVSVPYPFGYGPQHCYWPGFNLTCDMSSHPPRLLLTSDGSLRVVHISIDDNKMRIVRTGAINITSSDGGIQTVVGGDLPAPYILSTGNELVLVGCNVQATLLGVEISYPAGAGTDDIISGCASSCNNFLATNEYFAPTAGETGKYCSGIWCCQAAISRNSRPKGVLYRRFELNSSQIHNSSVLAFVAEEGWFDQRSMAADVLQASSGGHWHSTGLEVPLVLWWSINVNDTPVLGFLGDVSFCSPDTTRRLCKSSNAYCVAEGEGSLCLCPTGYKGNPYVADGCQDIDECNHPQDHGCFGDCTNTAGSFKCRCPTGYHGNHSALNGCVPYPIYEVRSISTGSVVGIAVGTVAGSIFLVLLAIFMTQRFKHVREMKLKQKYFKQNRGQLLQQLVSQRADIAERMVIPVDELAKATNNFDKARELGGGGHGTVYKGILSDLHVVAIKKPKMAIQKEIDEFINEVAILSQINHRNIVKLLGCCLETEVPLLVYEFISNGTLYHHLHVEGPRSLSWDNRLRIATETAKAIAYLHSSVSIPVIHRDIKSSNILLDDTLTSKVSDFGASRYIPIDKTGLTTRVQGTIGYLDPMYFYTGHLNEKSDVYSFGVILVELLTRKKPFSYLSRDGDGLVMDFVNLLAEGNLAQILDPQVTEEGSHEAQEVAKLAALCIKLTSDDRPTMRQVELILEGLYASKKSFNDNLVAMEFEENNGITIKLPPQEDRRPEESSRRYSMEHELLMSARYPR